MIHPHSFLFKETPEFVIFNELVFTTKEYMRNVIELDPLWLLEIAPHFYTEKDFKSDKGGVAPRGKGKSDRSTFDCFCIKNSSIL